MKRTILIVLAALILGAAPSVAFADDVNCPEHGYASCYFDGATKLAADGHLMKEYSCSCGDKWWVRS